CYFTDEEPAGIFWFLLAAALSEGAARHRARRSASATGRSPAPPSPPRPSLGRRLERGLKARLLPRAARHFPPRPAPQRFDLAAARRLLVVRQDQRLGNLLLITPFLQALRELAPQAEIQLLLGDRFAPLFEDCPWIDGRIVERKRWLIRHPYAYPRHLRRISDPPWEATFELSNPDTHSFYNALMTIVSRAPLRIGFDHPRSRPALSHPIAPPRGPTHVSLAPLLLLDALGSSPAVHPLRLPSRSMTTCAARSTEGPLLIHPGGRGAKRWPAERFAALITELARDSQRSLRLIGGPADQTALSEVTQIAGGVAQVRRLGSLAELLDELATASLYIGSDAGPLHVAAAAGAPTISLFVTSDPLRYAPLGGRHEALLLGAASRRRAAAAQPRLAGGSALEAHLYAARPRTVTPPSGAAADAEVAFVAERVRHALERAAAHTREGANR
ncbi:MAG: hypothetical protein GF330_06825, partial [Candidatus Eisenbacteria bacterium]|nr:hypothetical protein [Candidatus Eisenbacteria bacterium]